MTPRAQSGDARAIERMLGAVCRTIVRTARRYQRHSQQIPLEDLCQEATAHVVRQAVPKFDPEAALWNTYAGWWIRASVHRTSVRDRTVHVPEGAFLMGARANAVSLEEPTGNEDTTIVDELAGDWDDPGEEIEARTRRAMVDAVLRPPAFSAREAYLYYRRFRVGTSVEIIAQGLGVSREHVRQLVARLEVDVARAVVARRSQVRITPRCPGWPGRCGAVPQSPSGHCLRCWQALEREARGATSEPRTTREPMIVRTRAPRIAPPRPAPPSDGPQLLLFAFRFAPDLRLPPPALHEIIRRSSPPTSAVQLFLDWSPRVRRSRRPAVTAPKRTSGTARAPESRVHAAAK